MIKTIMIALCLTTVLMPRFAFAVNPITRLIKPGDVIAGHAEIEEDCKLCHHKFKRADQSTQCRDCHEKIDEDMKSSSGFHGKSTDVKVQECRACHTDHEGRGAKIAAFDHKTFEHTITDFPLFGGHSGVECKSCHAVGEKFRETPTACVGCHQEDDKHHGELGDECEECHTQKSWTEARFDHDKTGWPLDGGHQQVECDTCHTEQSYQNTPTTCVSCHREDDTHKTLFGRQCDTCHVTDDWAISTFAHARDTGYALDGGHRGVSCNSCHSGPLYSTQLDQSCESCHSRDDVHDGLRGRVCGTCHVVSSWTDAEFDHMQMSGFELLGKHAEAECKSCHTEPADQVDLPQTCNECHQEDDPHKQQLGSECQHCHNERGWNEQVVFDHSLTVFPLLGGHAEVECTVCHESRAYKDASTDCAACHRDDDVHAGSMGTDCADCHNSTDWSVWEFDHLLVTGYALEGAHDAVTCDACHVDQRGRRVEQPGTSCFSCHANDDVHFGEFGRQCGRCHTTTEFSQIKAVN